jgi:SAM-dependent methyltransferase
MPRHRSEGGFFAAPWDFDAPRETLADLEPDEVLREYLALIPGPRVLDLGMGEGEHALWLASQGFEVEGVDRDRPSVAHAEIRAMRLQLYLHTYLDDILEFPIVPGVYDLILATAVLHFLRPSDLPRLAERMVAGLRPGGLLYATALTTDDPGYALLRETGEPEVEPDTFDLGEPNAPDLLHFFRPNALRQLFPTLDVIHYAEERYLRPDADQGYNAAAVLLARRL